MMHSGECQYTLCQKCLQTWAAEEMEQSFLCPLCRQPAELKNFYVNRFIWNRIDERQMKESRKSNAISGLSGSPAPSSQERQAAILNASMAQIVNHHLPLFLQPWPRFIDGQAQPITQYKFCVDIRQGSVLMVVIKVWCRRLSNPCGLA